MAVGKSVSHIEFVKAELPWSLEYGLTCRCYAGIKSLELSQTAILPEACRL